MDRYVLEGVDVVMLLKEDFVGVFITSPISVAFVGVSFLKGSVSVSGSASRHALKL